MECDALTRRMTGLAMEIHRERGPGLRESACEECLAFARRAAQPVRGKGQILPVNEAQRIACLNRSGIHVGLLVSFNVPVLNQGLRRFVA